MPRSPRQLLDSSWIHGVSPDGRRLARVTYFRAGARPTHPDQSGELSLRRNGARVDRSEPRGIVSFASRGRDQKPKRAAAKTRAGCPGSTSCTK